MDKPLTAKQEAFSQSVGTAEFDYIWEAYAAHYNTKKMSQNSIYQESCKLLANPKITSRVAEIREEVRERNAVTLDEVLQEMSDWLRLDPIEYVDENNCAKSMHDLSPIARKNLASPIEIIALYSGSGNNKIQIGELQRIKMIDKRALSDQFMKKFGAYTTNLKIVEEDLSHVEDIVKGIQDAHEKK